MNEKELLKRIEQLERTVERMAYLLCQAHGGTIPQTLKDIEENVKPIVIRLNESVDSS